MALSNERLDRRTRISDKDYSNSSVYNKSVKSELTSLSVDLPKHRKKYTDIEKELLEKQGKSYPVTVNLASTSALTQTPATRSSLKSVAPKASAGRFKTSASPGFGT
jgi:hypothetical protein